MIGRFSVSTIRLRAAIAAAISVAVLGMPVLAFAQDRMVLGPRQFEFDKTGAGAVLCAWSVYLSIRAESEACGLARTPSDDAMDQAIAEMDEFILANSSLHPTRSMLEDFKRRANDATINDLRRRGLQQFCARPDLQAFRGINPEKIRTGTKALLAVPVSRL